MSLSFPADLLAFSRNHTIQIDRTGTAHVVEASQEERRIRLALQILDLQTPFTQLTTETAPIIEALRSSFPAEQLPAVFSTARESAKLTARVVLLAQIETNAYLRDLFAHHRPLMEQLLNRVTTNLVDRVIPTS